jgi:thioredoxin:protein disulfide reductase
MGLALTNSALGVAAALTGGLMGAVLQNPIVLALVAGVLILFATSLFGLWELRLPGVS